MLGPPRTPKNHAASARPSYALLSFAFTFCGTLPGNQSTLTSLHASRFCVAPIINTLVSVSILMPYGTVERPLVKFGPNLPPIEWRSQASVLMVEAPGTAPGSSASFSLHQQLILLYITR